MRLFPFQAAAVKSELVGEVFVQMPGLTARETGQFALYSSQSVENLSRMKV